MSNAPYTKCANCKYYAGYNVPMCTKTDNYCEYEEIKLIYSTVTILNKAEQEFFDKYIRSCISNNNIESDGNL